ncbi:hypothetical protein C8A05DRAFT_33930 [Staphylotrichum tortipilum]|uniref:SUN domain-containing protein n=1 Tax=Staphylotrichum tortipilum TaxID=2831512 RepID=A0AAN6MLE0_9PEZI|nr:hypothetical protein C8A05DRAFT_33930 [Staphylotrichum longicolle]
MADDDTSLRVLPIIETDDIPGAITTMPPRRRVRATASPSPAPHRGGTPARATLARTPVPAKYSTSYGSPIAQLPDRSTMGGGGNITKAAAQIFTTVQRDNVAAEARRRVKDQARTARTARAEQDDGQAAGGDDENASQPKEGAAKKSSQKTARKRSRDDDEDDAGTEKVRKERDARLQRERSEEARKRRAKASDDAQAAAAEKAKQDDLAQQAARDEAARAAMPPPPQPQTTRSGPGISVTPARASLSASLSTQRPSSARSFIEEVNLFHDALVQTPKSASPDPRQPGPPAPPVPAQSGSSPEASSSSPALPQRSSASPPSVLKRPPRRPGGMTPLARRERESSLGRFQPRTQHALATVSSPIAEEDEESPEQQQSPAEEAVSTTFRSRLQNRFNPLASPTASRGKQAESPPSTGQSSPRWSNVAHAFNPWSILKAIASAFVMLHIIRIVHIFVQPDVFQTPILELNWYGWNDWTSNIGQLFPSPLLHPLGVLTNGQYDDLKDYMQGRATTTEAAVDGLKFIMPKVVSVSRDKKGRIIIADEFWAALKDRIEHDSSLLTLDTKSAISDKHWKAIQARLKADGLHGKTLSADDVARIIEKSGPASWEKWLQNNKRRGSDEAVISRDEFLRELNARLARSKHELTSDLSTLRQDLHALHADVQKLAAESGSSITKPDAITLIQQLLNKELSRILPGGPAGPSADPFRNRFNHFAPGNAAQIDISLSSPTYQLPPPQAPLGIAFLFKSQPAPAPNKRPPQFLPEKFHALTPWSDAGHCWCAGTRPPTHPAVLAVRLARRVRPTHFVLEHISPSATSDPGATPKDIEIWAAFDDADAGRVRDWMAAQFPAAMGDGLVVAPPAGDGGGVEKGWAKIGGFRYEHRAKEEGVFVYEVSGEVAGRLRAATDLVMVRVLTNYGAGDHTCFYRVRLYGEEVEEEEE